MSDREEEIIDMLKEIRGDIERLSFRLNRISDDILGATLVMNSKYRRTINRKDLEDRSLTAVFFDMSELIQESDQKD